jgi:single-strand DNA-binding protein
MAGNATSVEGNLTADPELRYTQDGTAVANFTVASTERRRDANGEWQDAGTSFLRCVVWRQQAENVVESLAKGSRVVVTGKLKQSHWTTSEGEPRSSWELRVREVGPSLRYATAKVTKLVRGTASATTEDPWSSDETVAEPPAFAA